MEGAPFALHFTIPSTPSTLPFVPLSEKTFTVEPGSPEVSQRADRLVQAMCGLSRAQVSGLFDRGCVRLNDVVCTQTFERVKAGDRIVLKYDPQQRYRAENKPRNNLGFELIFEDKHLIVVNKPADMLTVPTMHGEENTLVNFVSTYIKHRGGRRAFTAHRLDRGVSGVLVLGKSQEVSDKLRDQFAERKPEREYVAIVAGAVKKKEGTFKSLLATDKNLNRFSTKNAEIGQVAITHYRIVQPLDDATLVAVWLETGRRNQIRVHFSEAGHPVLGDPRYRAELAIHPRWPWPRIALHARLLGFTHPINGQPLRFETPLPHEMEKFLAGSPQYRSAT